MKVYDLNSANDLFLTGPSQYPLIAVILLQFRSYPIAVTADISKMYREVKLQEQDKDYHRFFLRNEDGKICEARMTRLTFGMRPSPCNSAILDKELVHLKTTFLANGYPLSVINRTSTVIEDQKE